MHGRPLDIVHCRLIRNAVSTRLGWRADHISVTADVLGDPNHGEKHYTPRQDLVRAAEVPHRIFGTRREVHSLPECSRRRIAKRKVAVEAGRGYLVHILELACTMKQEFRPKKALALPLALESSAHLPPSMLKVLQQALVLHPPYLCAYSTFFAPSLVTLFACHMHFFVSIVSTDAQWQPTIQRHIQPK